MNTYTPAKQYILWSYNKSIFSTVYLNINLFTYSREEGKGLNDLKFGTFSGSFPSDALCGMHDSERVKVEFDRFTTCSTLLNVIAEKEVLKSPLMRTVSVPPGL